MTTIRQEYVAKWREQVIEIADGKYFTRQPLAEQFLHRYVLRAWTTQLAADDDDVLVKRFNLTPTMIRMIHLFGRGVKRVGAETRAPKFHVWPPTTQVDERGYPSAWEVIPQRDIARIIGASLSSVEEACRRFKRTGGGDDLHDRRLCAIVSLETGIALDGIFHPQMSLPFAQSLEFYEHAGQYAHEHRVKQSEFAARMRDWVGAAQAAKRLSVPRRGAVAHQQTSMAALLP